MSSNSLIRPGARATPLLVYAAMCSMVVAWWVQPDILNQGFGFCVAHPFFGFIAIAVYTRWIRRVWVSRRFDRFLAALHWSALVGTPIAFFGMFGAIPYPWSLAFFIFHDLLTLSLTAMTAVMFHRHGMPTIREWWIASGVFLFLFEVCLLIPWPEAWWTWLYWLLLGFAALIQLLFGLASFQSFRAVRDPRAQPPLKAQKQRDQEISSGF